MRVHEFVFRSLQGVNMPLNRWNGQPLLLVNTASECGFTPQYTKLQALWEEYRPSGLVVIGIPCDEFGAQEPGDEETIHEFCTSHYNVSFPMTEKQSILGIDAHPLFIALREEYTSDISTDLEFFQIPVRCRMVPCYVTGRQIFCLMTPVSAMKSNETCHRGDYSRKLAQEGLTGIRIFRKSMFSASIISNSPTRGCPISRASFSASLACNVPTIPGRMPSTPASAQPGASPSAGSCGIMHRKQGAPPAALLAGQKTDT